MFTAIGELASGVFSLGYLFLLGGLAAGLPSLDDSAGDAGDADDIDGDDIDGLADTDPPIDSPF